MSVFILVKFLRQKLFLKVFRIYDSLCLHSSIIFDDNFCDIPASYSSGPSFAFQSLMLPLKKIDNDAVFFTFNQAKPAPKTLDNLSIPYMLRQLTCKVAD